MRRLFLLSLCLMLCLSGCKQKTEPVYFFAMDTVISLQLEGDDGRAADACKVLIKELEEQLSITDENSVLSALNRTGQAVLSEELTALIREGLAASAETDQAFCLSLRPASKLWGFTDDTPHRPNDADLTAVRPLIDDSKIILNGNTLTLPVGAQLDLGGIAKGYAADRLNELLEEYGIAHALLSLGGNIQVRGGRTDGAPWRIGIADPDGGEYVGSISLNDGAVVTSGGYERNFTEDHVVYHHIIDRTTLYPADSGLKSVTVVSERGARADALSTALFVMGEEQALAFCRAKGDFECILITEDNRVVVSDGLKETFTLYNTQYHYE